MVLRSLSMETNNREETPKKTGCPVDLRADVGLGDPYLQAHHDSGEKERTEAWKSHKLREEPRPLAWFQCFGLRVRNFTGQPLIRLRISTLKFVQKY